MKRLSTLLLSAVLTLALLPSCGDGDSKPETKDQTPVVVPLEEDNNTGDNGNGGGQETAAPEHTDLDFAYGGDISWVTAMEKQGKKFANVAGEAADCFTLLSDLGMNAARFRVWVKPSASEGGVWGLCDIDDVVAKSIRAQKSGMKIMIDFHYSDTWADPSNQKKPAAWDNAATVAVLGDSAAAFTKRTLEKLKAANIDINWVQIGNETRGGMMLTSSKGKEASVNGKMGDNYVVIHNKCAAVAREIYPQTKIVTHFENGQNALWKEHAAVFKKLDFDILGLSLYPEYTKQGEYWVPDANGIAEKHYKNCASYMNSFATTYGKETMLCEIGVTEIEKEANGASLKAAFDYIKANVKSCKGIFYWEPECFNDFNHYGMGGFTNKGQPAQALIDTYKH